MNRARLVAMENTLFSEHSLDWDGRCAAIAEAGFAGVYSVPYPLLEYELPRLRSLSEAPRRHGLRLAAIYANIDLALPANHPANERVTRLFAEQEGAPRVELSFKRSDSAPPAADLDGAMLARVEPLLKIADRRGFDLLLYPHSFYPVEKPAHASAIISRIAHPRLGFLFPVSHVHAVSSHIDTLLQLRECAAVIRSFNLCGCRRSGPGLRSKCIHLPPGEGELPLEPLLAELHWASYRGDIILQGHGWTGDVRAQLKASLNWLARQPYLD